MNDFEGNRYVDTISKRNKIRRLIWNVVYILFFKTTPKWAFHSWRRMLLRAFGAKIGEGSKVSPTCIVWAPWNLQMGNYSIMADGVNCYSMNKIIVGNRVSISQRAFLCGGTHDISSLRLPLITKPIEISDYVWVCSEAFIAPGCIIGTGSVVAARAVVSRSVDDWTVVVGNPAKTLKKRIIAN